MIQFRCGGCGHRIRAEDKYGGKQAKCPECGNVVVVPPESTTIELRCRSCGQKISAPRAHAGRRSLCPKCKNTVVIPARAEASDNDLGTVRFKCPMCNEEIEEPQTSRGKLIGCPHCSCYVAVPSAEEPAQKAEIPLQPDEKDDTSDEHLEELRMGAWKTAEQKPALVTERRLPWFLDIFLYPTSKAGLTVLAIIIVVPLLFTITAKFFFMLASQFAPMLVLAVTTVLIGFIVRFIVWLYTYWYFCECIRDSAAGSVRAPETLASTPGLGELLWQWFRTIVCLAVFAAPTLIYYGHTRQTGTVFWALLACGLFFFPMALLAVVLFDSFSGLNPALLIGSIASTFLPYCAMIFVFGSAVFLIIEKAPDTGSSFVHAFVIHSISIYLLMVLAHVLGGFFHRYEQQLNWEV